LFFCGLGQLVVGGMLSAIVEVKDGVHKVIEKHRSVLALHHIHQAKVRCAIMTKDVLATMDSL